MNLYKKTEQFVIKSFKNSRDIIHSKRTVHWIKELMPDAGEALLIAGVAHDIERAFNGDWKKGSSDLRALKKHQNMSALEIEKFLKKEKADKSLIQKVKLLVSHHEEGGNKEQNILCDADCLAFFEEKALRWARKYKQENKVEEFKKKLDYIFNRLKSPKAKRIAEKWYRKVMDELKA